MVIRQKFQSPSNVQTKRCLPLSEANHSRYKNVSMLCILKKRMHIIKSCFIILWRSYLRYYLQDSYCPGHFFQMKMRQGTNEQIGKEPVCGTCL